MGVSAGLSAALARRGNRQAQLGSGTPGSLLEETARNSSASPRDLLPWNNSAQGLENGTSCKRQPSLGVCPAIASEIAAGITLGSPFPTGGCFSLEQKSSGFVSWAFAECLRAGIRRQRGSGFPSPASLLGEGEMLPWPAVPTSGGEGLAALQDAQAEGSCGDVVAPMHRGHSNAASTLLSIPAPCSSIPVIQNPSGMQRPVPVPGLTSPVGNEIPQTLCHEKNFLSWGLWGSPQAVWPPHCFLEEWTSAEVALTSDLSSEMKQF